MSWTGIARWNGGSATDVMTAGYGAATQPAPAPSGVGARHYGRGMAVARLASVSLDCADPQPLAEFWSALLEAEIAFRSEHFWAVRTADGWLTAVRVEHHMPPTWPDPAVPKQIHLDLSAPDLDAAEARAL